MALNMPQFRVKLMNRPEYTVRILQGAQVAWETERSKRDWPKSEDAGSLWSAYVVWSSSRERGLIDTNMPFDVFAEDIEEMEVSEEVVAVEPFPAGQPSASGSGTVDSNSTVVA